MSEIMEEAKQIAGVEKMNLYLSDEELLKLDQEEYYQKGIKEGIKEGIEQGIKEGIEQNRCEMIINMYKDKMPIETIAKYSNLSIKEIKNIIDQEK